MDALIHDLRYACRTLLHSPGFSVAVALILALGIGANASIFNLIDAYVLRPLPGVSDPDRLVDVRGTQREKLVGHMTHLGYADLRDRNRVFSGLMAYRPTVLDMGRGSETRRVQAALVSSDYFAVLGTGAARQDAAHRRDDVLGPDAQEPGRQAPRDPVRPRARNPRHPLRPLRA
jgi:hypothetical protein